MAPPHPVAGLRVACAFDHAGVPLREAVLEAVRTAGAEAIDLGVSSTDPVDYPDLALSVAEAVAGGEADRGLLVCGSGAGVSVAASKVVGIRAATVHDTYTAHQAVEHDDLNVLCLGARVIGPALAAEVVAAFVPARFSGEQRHQRRLEKLERMEREGIAALQGEVR